MDALPGFRHGLMTREMLSGTSDLRLKSPDAASLEDALGHMSIIGTLSGAIKFERSDVDIVVSQSPATQKAGSSDIVGSSVECLARSSSALSSSR